MSRYQVLRYEGCDWFTAGFISFLNWLSNAPRNKIYFMHLEIEFDPDEVTT